MNYILYEQFLREFVADDRETTIHPNTAKRFDTVAEAMTFANTYWKGYTLMVFGFDVYGSHVREED